MDEAGKIAISLTSMLNIVALVLCFLYAFQNWSLKKNKSTANKYFTLFLLNLAFIIFFFLLEDMDVRWTKYLIPFLLISVLLMPPLMWIYLKKLVVYKIKQRNFIHLITPLGIGTIGLTLFTLVLVLPRENAIIYLQLFTYVVLYGITVVFLILNVLYIVLSIMLLVKHRRNIANHYSYTEQIDLAWVQVLIYGYVFLVLGLVVCELFKGDLSNLIFYGTLIVYIVYTGYQSLRQKEIQLADPVLRRESKQEETTQEEEISEESDQQFTEAQHAVLQDLAIRLKNYVDAEKPYLDQELTVFKLARDLQTNTRYLSYVINKEFNQSFINYINQLRIEEVKNKLRGGENQHLTIEALAQNAGFKSKSSFNAAFKRHAGTTPSGYLKEQA